MNELWPSLNIPTTAFSALFPWSEYPQQQQTGKAATERIISHPAQAPGPSAPLKLLHHRWPNYNHTRIPSTLPSCLVLPSSSPLNHMISYMTFQVVNNVNVEFGVRWYGMHYITRAAGKHPLIKSFESITSNTMQCAMWEWLPWRIVLPPPQDLGHWFIIKCYHTLPHHCLCWYQSFSLDGSISSALQRVVKRNLISL